MTFRHHGIMKNLHIWLEIQFRNILKHINKISSSPFFLSLIPFLIICFTITPDFNKYSLTSEKKTILSENQYVWYNDIDNDGISERIFAFQQDITTAVLISKNDAVIDQWNLKGTFNFWFKRCLFIPGDANGDGIKEIYVFTLNNDTILLHCIKSPYEPALSIKNRIIAKTGNGAKKPDPFIFPGEMDDLDGNGIKEVIFGIGSGFSRFPRKVFAYYIQQDSLVESPESSYFITGILQADINSDGKKEIMPYGYASANIDPVNALYHDHSTFTMVLDNNLKFLFRPVEIKGKYTALSPLIIRKSDRLNTRVAWLHSGEKINSSLYFLNNSGLISDSLSLKYQIYDSGNLLLLRNKELLHVFIRDGLGLIDKNFKLVKTIPDVKPSGIFIQDMDDDSKQEILILEKGKIHVYREGYNNEVSIPADIIQDGSEIITIQYLKGSEPHVSIQSGVNHYMLHYGINPAYPYFYLYYPGVYLSILVFALAIKNIQKNQSQKKYETENRISELQLALIRNQLDPHFTFNVINSIIYSVEFNENEQAASQLRHFAGLYRNMLLSAASTRRTIDEELEFCENYLRLEKMRFKEKLDYNISVAADVDRNCLVPKFIIQIYAENSVKHGLSALDHKGFINIYLKNDVNSLVIEISDNGIGRQKSAATKSSTGRGLKTMEELFSVYNRHYNERISSEIIDLYNINGEATGTRVIIKIGIQNAKS